MPPHDPELELIRAQYVNSTRSLPPDVCLIGGVERFNNRSQLEGLLDVILPSLHSAVTAKTHVKPRGEQRQSGVAAGAACVTTSSVPGTDESSSGEMATAVEGKVSEISGENGDDDGGGGDESAGGGVDELKRRCAALGVSLRASRREALEARRARDAAESTVREQREALTTLEGTVSELKEALEKEKEARQVRFCGWGWGVAW